MGGIDQLLTMILKQAGPSITEPLSLIFNDCLAEGYYPKHVSDIYSKVAERQ